MQLCTVTNMKNNFISKLLEQHDFINVYEIGARGGAFKDLHKYQKNINYFGFEANEDECKKLNLDANRHTVFNKEVYYQKGVGGEINRPSLYVTSQPGCSSFLEPNEKILKFYNRQEWYEIDNVYEIQTSSLESIKNELKLESPDFLKIDAEGMDLEILKGLGDSIDDVLGLRMEINYLDHRKQQPSVGEIFTYLEENNFYVFDFLENHSWRLDSKMGDKYIKFNEINYSKGQLAHGDILAFKNPIDIIESPKYNLSTKIKYAALLDCYGYVSHVNTIFQSKAFKKIFSEKQSIENKKFLIASSKSLLFSRVIQKISDSFGFLKTNLKFFFKRR